MNSVIMEKIVLYFDLDQTLFDIKREGVDALSDSAKKDLSPKILCSVFGDYENRPIEPLAKEDFKNVFQKISEVNTQSSERRVYVHILTNGGYNEFEISELLKRMYGTAISIDKFQNIFQGNKPGARRVTSKGEEMDLDYEKIYSLKEIPKSNVYLIDDSRLNCDSAEAKGFQSFHLPSSLLINARTPGQSYKSEKPIIFDKLNTILDGLK